MSVYATTDLHGRLDLYNKMKAILKPKDRVYFLGDAGDELPPLIRLRQIRRGF